MYDPPQPAATTPYRSNPEIICDRVHPAVSDSLPEISEKVAAAASDIARLLDHVGKITGNESETAAHALRMAYRSLQNAQEDLEYGTQHVMGHIPQRNPSY